MPSIAGAIRTTLVSASLPDIASRIYRDIAPPETQFPYVTIIDEITNTPTLLGDKTVLARTRQMRVNLWQMRTSEKVELIDQIVACLESVAISANKDVFRVRVSDVQRVFNSDDDTILHAVTLTVTQKA